MGGKKKKLLKDGEKGSRHVMALFDSGASHTLIRKNVAQTFATITKLRHPMSFGLGDGKGKVVAKSMVGFQLHLKGCQLLDDAVVVDELSDEIIIGASTLQKYRLILDFDKEDVIIDKKRINRLMLV